MRVTNGWPSLPWCRDVVAGHRVAGILSVRALIPTDLRPMLAVAGALPADDDSWAYEMKWDGARALLAIERGKSVITSRLGNDVTARYPELRGVAEVLGGTTAVLDGELVALDDGGRPSFERLQRRMHVSSPLTVRRLMVEVPVVVMLFDVLWLDGHGTCDLAYEDRRVVLERLGVSGPHWQTPPDQRGGGAGALATSARLGLEGIVAKRLGSRYEPGRRSPAWRKIKRVQTQDLVVGGWLRGTGRLDGRLGSLLVGYHDAPGGRLRYAGRVGSGIDETTRARLAARLASLVRPTSPFESTPRLVSPTWVEPVVVVQVGYAEWTDAGVLRAPRFRGLRDDVDAATVGRELIPPS